MSGGSHVGLLFDSGRSGSYADVISSMNESV